MENKSLLPLALTFINRGWSVIICGQDKRPLISWKEFQTRRATIEEVVKWFEQFPEAQLGVVTGEISNLTVIDVESDGDLNLIKDETLTVKTGGNGRHYYFEYDQEFTNAVRILPSIDVRSEGGYIITAGSKTTKGDYSVLKDFSVVKMSKETKNLLVEAKNQKGGGDNVWNHPMIQSPAANLDYSGYGAGQRNDEMTRYVGSVLARIHPSLWETVAWDMIKAANQKNKPPLGEREVRSTFNSVKSREARQNPQGRAWGPNQEQSRPQGQFGPIGEVLSPHVGDKKATIMHASEVADMQIIDTDNTFAVGMKPFDDALLGGFSVGDLIVVAGRSGVGKCLAKGTQVVMWNGELKKVEDIKTGDKLMGPDSKPRNVFSTCHGSEMLYKITPRRGDSYTVNESHILSLVHKPPQKKSRVVNMPVLDFLKLGKTAKVRHYGYHTGVYWHWHKGRKLPIDPYFLGLWLGDGNSRDSRITSADPEIRFYLRSYADSIGHIYSEHAQVGNKSLVCSIRRENRQGKRPGGLQGKLRSLGVLENKHIPLRYKANNRKNRLRLLAGLIDSDGYLGNNHLTYTSKLPILANDVAFLARSLGFFSIVRKTKKHIKSTGFIGEYFQVSISGELSEIPVLLKRKKAALRKQIKDVQLSSITVTPAGVGDYYGFQIDSDGLFLLGDLTVTHNTTLIQDWSTTMAMGGNNSYEKLPALWFSYEVLAKPLWMKFQKIGADKETPIFLPSYNESGNSEWVVEMIKVGIKDKGIRVVAIDHLGFLRAPRGNYANQADAITNTVRLLKRIAVENGLIIILPVHVRKTKNKTLDIDDIKDSSGVVQEADTVFFIDRMKNDSGVPTEQAKLWLSKNRKTGIAVSGIFDFRFGRYFYNEIASRDEGLVDDEKKAAEEAANRDWEILEKFKKKEKKNLDEKLSKDF